MGGDDSERGAKAVENEFGVVICGIPMAWYPRAGDPVGDAEVEHGTCGEVHDVDALGLFEVLVEDHEVGVAGVFGGGVGCDFSDGVFVAVEVGGSADVVGVREELCEELGFVVEGGIY